MAWKQIGSSGEIVKWAEPGQVIEGAWIGTHDGKFGLLGSVKQPDGRSVSFSMSAVLVDRFGTIEAGQLVRIIYRGKGKTKAGGQLNLFDVFVDEPEDEPQGEPA